MLKKKSSHKSFFFFFFCLNYSQLFLCLNEKGQIVRKKIKISSCSWLRILPFGLSYTGPVPLLVLILEKTNEELKHLKLGLLKPSFHTSDLSQWHTSKSSPLWRCFGRHSCCDCQIKSRGFRIICQHQRQPYQEPVLLSQRSLLWSMGLLPRTPINLAVFTR